MSRNIVLALVLLLVFPTLGTRGTATVQNNTVTILPRDCRMVVSGEVPLKLEGSIPSNSVITWDVSSGGIVSQLPGRKAVFVAPSRATVVTISASISPAIPGMETPIVQQCTITSLNNTLNELALLTGAEGFSGN
ncbi:MAG TPA: hypothetical protein VK249_09000 [Anaerolineales bacterium]|nr:hypothetical protein [Anaerolineales bacterium]